MESTRPSCPVCISPFGTNENEKPRAFPCGHSFCHSCIQGLKNSGTNNCPTCKATINLSSLPPHNFSLVEVLSSSTSSFRPKCPGCSTPFGTSDAQKPRFFICGHSTCHSCFQRQQRTHANSCPTCKTTVNLSPLPPLNFSLVDAIESPSRTSAQSRPNQPVHSSAPPPYTRPSPQVQWNAPHNSSTTEQTTANDARDNGRDPNFDQSSIPYPTIEMYTSLRPFDSIKVYEPQHRRSERVQCLICDEHNEGYVMEFCTRCGIRITVMVPYIGPHKRRIESEYRTWTRSHWLTCAQCNKTATGYYYKICSTCEVGRIMLMLCGVLQPPNAEPNRLCQVYRFAFPYGAKLA